MIVAPLAVSVVNLTASPTLRSLSCASPFLSMSLAEVTPYVVVPLLVLIVTELLPTAVTVPSVQDMWLPRPGSKPGAAAEALLAVCPLPVVVDAAVAPTAVAITAPAAAPARMPAPIARPRRRPGGCDG